RSGEAAEDEHGGLRPEAGDHRARLLRLRRIGDVPHLVTGVGDRVADRAQQIRLALPVAYAGHLRPALLTAARRAGNVAEVAGLRGVGGVDDRRAVVLLDAGERVARAP